MDNRAMLPHAIGLNVAGVIGSTTIARLLIAFLG